MLFYQYITSHSCDIQRSILVFLYLLRHSWMRNDNNQRVIRLCCELKGSLLNLLQELVPTCFQQKFKHTCQRLVLISAANSNQCDDMTYCLNIVKNLNDPDSLYMHGHYIEAFQQWLSQMMASLRKTKFF